MTDIQMTVKRPQNTDEKVQLELIKSSKLFYKLDASILPHLSLTKQKNLQSLQNQTPRPTAQTRKT